MKRLGLILLVFCCGISPVFALSLDTLPSYQDAGMRSYVRGTQKLQEGDFVGAVEELRQAVRLRPDMGEAFHNLGFAFERTGDPKNAVRAYERALALNANYASALNNLGFLLATLEMDKPRAVQLCQRAVELEPSSASYRDSLGWACYKAGRHDEAILHFQNAIKLDPTFFKPHFNLGLCEFTRKNWSEAVRYLTNAIRLNANYVKAYVPLAVAYENMQQNGRALYVYQQAMPKVPERSPLATHIQRQVKRLTDNSKSYYFANVKNMQGSSRVSQFLQKKRKGGRLAGETGGGTTPYETTGTFTPVSVAQAPVPEAWSQPASSLTAPQPTRSAVPLADWSMPKTAPSAAFRAPVELTVTQERELEKRYSLCKSYLDRGLVDDAARDLEKIVALGGDSTIGRQARNLLLRVRKDQDGRSKEAAQTHLAMGKDFFRAGKYDMAEAEIRKTLSLAPDTAEAYKDLALLHYNQGKLRDAYEESKKAIALDRSLKEAYIVLASLYSKKGRVQEAVATLRRVRDISTGRDSVDDLADRMLASLHTGL